MLRSIAELTAYGTLAVLLAAASLAPKAGNAVSSATTGNVAADERAPTIAADRGALLFATKGCVGCHMHASFPNARMQVGPDLTALADRAATRVAGLDARAYVRQSLSKPGAYRVSGGYATVMPDLGLNHEQIESLTAFLLASTR